MYDDFDQGAEMREQRRLARTAGFRTVRAFGWWVIVVAVMAYAASWLAVPGAIWATCICLAVAAFGTFILTVGYELGGILPEYRMLVIGLFGIEASIALVMLGATIWKVAVLLVLWVLMWGIGTGIARHSGTEGGWRDLFSEIRHAFILGRR